MNESSVLSSSDRVNTQEVLTMIICSMETCDVRLLEACREPCIKGCSCARHALRAESSDTMPCIDAGASLSRRRKSMRLVVSLDVTDTMPTTDPITDNGSTILRAACGVCKKCRHVAGFLCLYATKAQVSQPRPSSPGSLARGVVLF